MDLLFLVAYRMASSFQIGDVFSDNAQLLRAIADLESETSQIFCIGYSESNKLPELQVKFPRAKMKFVCRCSGTKRQAYKVTGARPNQT